jgi:hypothetical protein
MVETLEDRSLPSFSLSASYPVGDGARAVAAADVNGDGKPDLVSANSGPDFGMTYISVLLANNAKNGKQEGFGPAWAYHTTLWATSLGLADVNGDRRPDAVLTDGLNVEILFNNGAGAFQVARTYSPSDPAGDYVGAGDFNGDGVADIVTSNGVLLGAGNDRFGYSTFGSFLSYFDSPTGTECMAVGDLNRDGMLDLLVRGWDGASGAVTVSLVPGNAAGDLSPSRTVFALAPGGGGYWEIKAVAVADFNPSGNAYDRPDVAVAYARYATSPTSGVYVDTLLASVGGTFTPAGSYALGVNFVSDQAGEAPRMRLATADVNGDGRVDLVTIGSSPSSSGYEVRTLPGKGDGTFGAATPVPAPVYSTVFAADDFNGDGYADLVVLRNTYASYLDLLTNDKQWGTKRPGK